MCFLPKATDLVASTSIERLSLCNGIGWFQCLSQYSIHLSNAKAIRDKSLFFSRTGNMYPCWGLEHAPFRPYIINFYFLILMLKYKRCFDSIKADNKGNQIQAKKLYELIKLINLSTNDYSKSTLKLSTLLINRCLFIGANYSNEQFSSMQQK